MGKGVGESGMALTGAGGSGALVALVQVAAVRAGAGEQIAQNPAVAEEVARPMSLPPEEPPGLEVVRGRGNGGLLSGSLALVGACHSRLRAYTLKFIGFLTQRLDSDSGSRPPNVLESQAADKALWQMIHDLVLDQKFTLDNALHKVTHLRSDMAPLLQPRPKVSNRQPQPSSSAPTTGSAKGRGKSKRKGKQGGKKGDSVSRPIWVTEATVPRESGINCVCNFQSRKSQKRDPCRFRHLCAHPLASGQAYGQQHSAFDHQQHPH